MNTQELKVTQRVSIKEDKNLKNTHLENATGLIMKKEGLLFHVLITSGEYKGQTYPFVQNQLMNN